MYFIRIMATHSGVMPYENKFKFSAHRLKILPPVYQKITFHVIFDFNMGDKFRRKYQFVLYGHKTQTLPEMT